MAEREMRDRVAEARRLHDFNAGGLSITPKWTKITQAQRDFWLRKADDLIADFASLNLAIVEKDSANG